MKNVPRVLFIDDDPDDIEYHEIIVNKTGANVKVVSVTDSRKALECWEGKCGADADQNPVPEIVFLDINMPALSGLELLERIQQVHDPHGRKKEMAIFILSNSQNPEDRKIAKTFGDLVKGFYPKPLTSQLFLQIEKDYLRKEE